MYTDRQTVGLQLNNSSFSNSFFDFYNYEVASSSDIRNAILYILLVIFPLKKTYLVKFKTPRISRDYFF